MQAVILAGGLGMRLRPLTEVIPKPLLPIGEASILEIIIGNFAQFGFEEIFIATNYRSELIESYIGDGEKFGIKIGYSREEEPLGTAGPLGLLRERITDDFVLINGDILTNLDFSQLRSWHAERGHKLTLVTKSFQTPLSYGVVSCEGDRVLGIEEKPVVESIINAGIYCISPSCLSFIPENERYDMNTFIRTLIQSEYPVGRYALDSYWFDIGQFQDYERAQEWHRAGKLKIHSQD